MDILITKDGVDTTLSSIGILVKDFQTSSPSVVSSKREVRNRNGYIFSGAVHKEKIIIVSGTFSVPTIYQMEEKKDELNGLVSNDEPFYITQMLPTQEMYRYELPGQTSSDLQLLAIPHEAYKYRYYVISDSEVVYDFIGKTAEGLRTRFSFQVSTAELPFGETKPVNQSITSYIEYRGTAKCSQLEHPWQLKLTATEEQSGTFNLKVGNRTFTHTTQTPIAVGDVFILKGVETTHNAVNVNLKTNYEYFILSKMSNNRVPVSTNFKGTIEILNKKEFYK